MSLVGPRPLVMAEAQTLTESWQARRADLRPGLTGPWQISGRSNIPFQEMIRFDYQYVAGWSLARDVEILIATLPSCCLGPRRVLTRCASSMSPRRPGRARSRSSATLAAAPGGERPRRSRSPTPTARRRPPTWRDSGHRRRARRRSRGRGARRPSQLAAGRALRRLVRERRPDLVHLHSSFAGAVGALALPRGVPLIYTPHGLAFARTGVGRAPASARVRAVEALVARRCALARRRVRGGGGARPRAACARRASRWSATASPSSTTARPSAPSHRRRAGRGRRWAASPRRAGRPRPRASSPRSRRAPASAGSAERRRRRRRRSATPAIPVTGWLPRAAGARAARRGDRVPALVRLGRAVARDPRGDRARRRRRRLRHPGQPRGRRRRGRSARTRARRSRSRDRCSTIPRCAPSCSRISAARARVRRRGGWPRNGSRLYQRTLLARPRGARVQSATAATRGS